MSRRSASVSPGLVDAARSPRVTNPSNELRRVVLPSRHATINPYGSSYTARRESLGNFPDPSDRRAEGTVVHPTRGLGLGSTRPPAADSPARVPFRHDRADRNGHSTTSLIRRWPAWRRADPPPSGLIPRLLISAHGISYERELLVRLAIRGERRLVLLAGSWTSHARVPPCEQHELPGEMRGARADVAFYTCAGTEFGPRRDVSPSRFFRPRRSLGPCSPAIRRGRRVRQASA